MSDIAILVENLSKQYRIGGPQARYKTIRESLAEAVQSPFRRAAKLLRGQALRLGSGQAYGAAEMDETIWALKDVSFEVKRGEVVGIPSTGSGQHWAQRGFVVSAQPNGGQDDAYFDRLSTGLKILSRIVRLRLTNVTEPTEGYAEVYGRVGSLLEVGTGFHPELTLRLRSGRGRTFT